MKTHGIKWLGLSLLLLAGFLLVAPSAFAASDGGYSATCKDGSTWTGTSKRGACRGHKGVKNWNSEPVSSTTAEPAAKTTHSRSSKKAEEAAPAANATPAAAAAVSATCKDGTSWSGKSKSGACRGHKGVKSWGDEAAAAATPAAAPAPTAAPAAPTAPAPVSHRTSTTASAGGAMGSPAPGGGAGKVWVNTESKTYHCQGTKWYGTTKHGEYMTEAQAKAQGYHADHGKACSG
ncbi:MAG: hypothetical protein OJF61_000980 [Rhodanobacteraceae bacterium]|jgi:hypothetical protein|nr:MAG: hypothetical protein OJF61_000980 [Rhodanobacteraceae bacterium]